MVTRFGGPALAALRDVLAHVRDGDPMTAVDVAVPSAFAGITVRRRFANPGLVGVRFAPLPRLITDRALPVLAAAGVQPLTSADRRAVTRGVLAGSGGGLADSARRSARTVDVVAGVFAELDESAAGAAAIRTLAAGGRWPAELAVLYRRYLDVIATAAGPEQVAEAALASTRDTPLIIYLPRRLTRIELRFCEGMAARGQLHAVVALTGEQAADRDALAIRDALDPVPATAAPPFPARARAQTRALPDAEEEARYAVRRIFAQLERAAGHLPGPHRDRLPCHGAVRAAGRRAAVRGRRPAPCTTAAPACLHRAGPDAAGLAAAAGHPVVACRRSWLAARCPGPRRRLPAAHRDVAAAGSRSRSHPRASRAVGSEA